MKSVVSKVIKNVCKTTAGKTSSEELKAPIHGNGNSDKWPPQPVYDYYYHYLSEQPDSDCSYRTYSDRYNQTKYSFNSEYDKKSPCDKIVNYDSLSPRDGFYGGLADIVDIYDNDETNKFYMKGLPRVYNENHGFHANNEIIAKDQTLNNYYSIKQKPIIFKDLYDSKRKRSVSPPVRLHKVKRRKTSHHGKKEPKKQYESPDIKTPLLCHPSKKIKNKNSSKNKNNHKKISKKIKKHGRSIKKSLENDEFLEKSFKPMKIDKEEEPDLIATILHKNSVLGDTDQSVEEQKSLAMSRLMKHYNKNVAVSELIGKVRKKLKEQKLNESVAIKNTNNEDSSKNSSRSSEEMTVSIVSSCPSVEAVFSSVQSGCVFNDKMADDICTESTNKDFSDFEAVEQSSNFVEKSDSFNNHVGVSVLSSPVRETEAGSEVFESDNTDCLINSESFSTSGNIAPSLSEKMELANYCSNRCTFSDDGVKIVEDASREVISQNVANNFDVSLTELSLQSAQFTNVEDMLHRSDMKNNVDDNVKVDVECKPRDQSNEMDNNIDDDVALNEVEGDESCICVQSKSEFEGFKSADDDSKSFNDDLKQCNDLKSTKDMKPSDEDLKSVDADEDTKLNGDQHEKEKNDVWPVVNMSIVKPVGSSKGMSMNLKITEKSASFIASGEVVFHRKKKKNLEDGELSDDNSDSSSSSSDDDDSEDKSTAGTYVSSSSCLTSSSCVDADSTGSLSESDEEKAKNKEKTHKKKKTKKEMKMKKLRHRGRSRSFSVTRTFDAEFGVWREKKIRKKIREPIFTESEKDKLRRIAMTAAMSSKDTDRYIRSFRISRESHDKQKKIAQLTNFCKSLARKNGDASGNSSDEDDCEKLMMMSDNEDMVGCVDLIERPSRIVMNIRDARIIKVNAQEKQLKAEVLREVYPISSGVMHHARNKGWVPVEKDAEPTQKNFLQSPPKHGNPFVSVPPESLTDAAGAAIQLANAQKYFKIPTAFPYDQAFLHSRYHGSSYRTSGRFQAKSVLLKRKNIFSKLQDSFIASSQHLHEAFESQNEVQSNEMNEQINTLQPEIITTEPCSSVLPEPSIPLIPTASLKASLNCMQNYDADAMKSTCGSSEASSESASMPAPVMDPNLLFALNNRLKAPTVYRKKPWQLHPSISRISASYLSAFHCGRRSTQRVQNSFKDSLHPSQKTAITSQSGPHSEVGKILLMKMGWKEGELLGSTSSNANPGLPAPIDVAFKNDKKGLQSEEERLFSTSLVHKAAVHDKHPVSKLGEICRKKNWPLPSYDLVEETGPPHRKYFRYKVAVNGKDYVPIAASCSKKAAKCDAAICCLTALNIL